MKREDSKVPSMSAEELDRLLEADAQVSMSNFVRELPEEPLSLAWRSDLNAKLRLTAKKQAKRRWLFRIEASLGGLALAGALVAGIMFMRAPQPAPPTAGGIEGLLLQEHRDMTASDDVAGAGLTLYDAARQNGPASPSAGDQLSEGDTEVL